MFSKALSRLSRFRRAQGGSAVVEFALIVPIMLAVYIGTVEASTLIIVDRKVQSVSGTIGDLASRADKTLASSRLQDYLLAASGIMEPYDSDGVVQTVTAIHVLEDGSTDVVWQAKYEHGTYTRIGQANLPNDFTLPQEMIDVSKKHMVIAAEASYAYTPLFGLVFDQSINLYRSNFYMTRYGDDITLN